jgi:hypothetical protein
VIHFPVASHDLLSNCINFQADEQKTFAKVDELVKDGGHQAIEITKLLNELKTVYAVWDKDYAQMSRLAEDNKFGSGNYWAYRPDIARFDKAHKFEAPGLASQVKKPPKGGGKVAPELTDEQLNEQARTNNELISKGVKDAQAVERQLPGARARAMALSNKLEPLVADRKKPAAVKLYDQAYDLFTSAEKAAARIKPHDMKDLNSYGTQALQDYSAAAAALTKALAMFPKA